MPADVGAAGSAAALARPASQSGLHQQSLFCAGVARFTEQYRVYWAARAGVEVSPANLAAGLKFTWPTYKSGLRVMISAQRQSGSTWAFSEIFHWKVGRPGGSDSD